MSVKGINAYLYRANSQPLRSGAVSFQNNCCCCCGCEKPKTEPTADSFASTTSLKDQLAETQNALTLACRLLVLAGVKAKDADK